LTLSLPEPPFSPKTSYLSELRAVNVGPEYAASLFSDGASSHTSPRTILGEFPAQRNLSVHENSSPEKKGQAPETARRELRAEGDDFRSSDARDEVAPSLLSEQTHESSTPHFMLKVGILTLIAGLLSAGFGIGGGVLVVPSLITFFRLDMKKAILISVTAVLPISVVGFAVHLTSEMAAAKLWMAVRIGLPILLGSLLASWRGVKFVEKAKSENLKRAFMVVLMAVGMKYLFFPDGESLVHDGSSNLFSPYLFYPSLAVIGLFGGASAALFGVGGGIFYVPVLNLLYGMPFFDAVTTSFAVIIPNNIFLYWQYRKSPLWDARLRVAVVWLFAGTGAGFGAWLIRSLPESMAHAAFGVFLTSVSAWLFRQSWVLSRQQKKTAPPKPEPRTELRFHKAGQDGGKSKAQRLSSKPTLSASRGELRWGSAKASRIVRTLFRMVVGIGVAGFTGCCLFPLAEGDSQTAPPASMPVAEPPMESPPDSEQPPIVSNPPAAAPSAPVIVNAIPQFTNQFTFLFDGTKDPGTSIEANGIVVVAFDQSSTWWANVDLPMEGLNDLVFVARNDQGVASSETHVSITRDTQAPAGSIAINQGAQVTHTPEVSLNLSAHDALSLVSGMDFSTDNSNWSSPEPFALTRPITLGGEDGPKTVYVRYYDQAGNRSNPFSATIQLETVPNEPSLVFTQAGDSLSGIGMSTARSRNRSDLSRAASIGRRLPWDTRSSYLAITSRGINTILG
jgi:uncharacterized membrane protein YfcA